MTRGTTPTVTITVDGIDLTTLQKVCVTFRQNGKLLNKYNCEDGVEITESTVAITLTQEETLAFKSGSVEVQLRGVTENGAAIATEIAKTCVKGVLYDEVLS